ncbi:hypothetical protein GQ457_09G002960 [Hibiscus cannabinus]
MVNDFLLLVDDREPALLKTVANQLIPVAIDAGGGADFQHCKSEDDDGTEHWLVKSSWGISWGEDQGRIYIEDGWGNYGYNRMQQRDIDVEDDGHCGITMETSSPIKVS